MKKLLFLSSLLLGLFMFTGSYNAKAVSASAGGYCGCAVCNCWHYYGNCAWCVTDAIYSGAQDQMPVDIIVTGKNTVQITYQIPLAGRTHEEDLAINSDVIIPQSICQQLGVHSIVLSQGVYSIDYSKNSNGSITCNAVIQ